MPASNTYIAVLRVAFASADEVNAQAKAEKLEEEIEEHLEEEDTVRTTQLFSLGDPVRPEEMINHLKIARNDLCRLPYADCMNLAQSLDRVVWMLEKTVPEDDAIPNDYDWNRIIEIKHAVVRGENPLF